jgi:hypothetical protein
LTTTKVNSRENQLKKAKLYRAVRSGAAMVLRSSVVLGGVGIDGTLFMLWIAHEVHAGGVIKGWSHRLGVRRWRWLKGRDWWVFYD